MSRADVNKLLVRVGVDPKTAETKAKACLLIHAARAQYVKRYKTKAQQEKNVKTWKEGLELNYGKRLNNAGKRYENARNQQRRANTKKINNYSEGVVARGSPQEAQGARLRLFKKLGL
jgi:hypothetical protein